MVARKNIARLVFAHGAGAGMDHSWIVDMARALQVVGIASARYNFPFMQSERRVPDRPPVLKAAVREAVARTGRRSPTLPLIAGGKSLGGRMTAYAQAEAPLPGVRGLVFFGFPLHPAKKPGIDRAAPLDAVGIPMLFLQGTRDPLAEPELMRQVVHRLGAKATLVEVPQANHAFHVPKRTGYTDQDIRRRLAEAVLAWLLKTHNHGN